MVDRTRRAQQIAAITRKSNVSVYASVSTYTICWNGMVTCFYNLFVYFLFSILGCKGDDTHVKRRKVG